jgi:hypothetical protein
VTVRVFFKAVFARLPVVSAKVALGQAVGGAVVAALEVDVAAVLVQVWAKLAGLLDRQGGHCRGGEEERGDGGGDCEAHFGCKKC